MSKEDNGTSWTLFIVPFIVAYIGSRLIFHFSEFDYNLFAEPLSATKLFIDVSVFGGLFFATYIAARKLHQSCEREDG
ncbi:MULTISPECIES: hypothetical protein [Gammaproteobacteria]|uniref:hypothetical protein n=1 Tax=Gammaproteobacteria TaxID=1236 RepID=UPI000DD01417|nr:MULTISPECIES: hypothetical protein [Gammaproteobacteria]RTE87681.1 hypothetical protein DQX04_04750 [Aliidiomarina sp. B3213]TCZ92535.1 hypothetical protein EYQ95_00545 [Lysobacter sp. N42]